MIRSWHLTLTASVALLGICDIGRSMEWKPVETTAPLKRTGSNAVPIRWTPLKAEPSTPSPKPQWERLSTDPEHPLPKGVVWTPVKPGVAADLEEKIKQEAPIEDPSNAAISIQLPAMPSGTTFANDKAIWRYDEWHPQISGSVPVGFGPKGFMMSTSIWAIDCVTGAGYCANTHNFDEYFDQVSPQPRWCRKVNQNVLKICLPE